MNQRVTLITLIYMLPEFSMQITIYSYLLFKWIWNRVCVCVCVCMCVYHASLVHSFFPFLFFVRLHLLHIEVPGLGVKLEIQLPAYITATATLDLNHICDLHLSLQQRHILNPWAMPGIEPASSETLCQVLNPLSHSTSSLFLIAALLKYNSHTIKDNISKATIQKVQDKMAE